MKHPSKHLLFNCSVHVKIVHISTDIAPNADIKISAISALKMFADSRYADTEKKKCRYCRCRYKYRDPLIKHAE